MIFLFYMFVMHLFCSVFRCDTFFGSQHTDQLHRSAGCKADKTKISTERLLQGWLPFTVDLSDSLQRNNNIQPTRGKQEGSQVTWWCRRLNCEPTLSCCCHKRNFVALEDTSGSHILLCLQRSNQKTRRVKRTHTFKENVELLLF